MALTPRKTTAATARASMAPTAPGLLRPGGHEVGRVGEGPRERRQHTVRGLADAADQSACGVPVDDTMDPITDTGGRGGAGGRNDDRVDATAQFDAADDLTGDRPFEPLRRTFERLTSQDPVQSDERRPVAAARGTGSEMRREQSRVRRRDAPVQLVVHQSSVGCAIHPCRLPTGPVGPCPARRSTCM